MDGVSGVVKDNSAVRLPSHTAAAVLLTEPVVVEEEEEGGWWWTLAHTGLVHT